MANLIPVSKTNQQKSPIIKVDKFLPRVKSSAIVPKNFEGNSAGLLGSPILRIERKVIQIDKVLKDSLLLSKKENEKKRIKKEEKSFSEKEKELEKKKPKEIKSIKLPSLLGMGIFGAIKNFIVQTVIGFLAVRLIDYLPKLLGILPTIIKVTDFITDIGGKLLNGLVTFIDWGYKAADGTRQFIKNIGGESWANNFDKFTGALSTMLDVAVLAALSAGSMGSDDGGPGGSGKSRRGYDTSGRRVSRSAHKRYYERYGREQFLERFGKEGLENLPSSMRRGGVERFGRRAFVGVLGKGGAKTVLGFVRPFLKRIPIPIVGALIDFGLSWALGEDPGRAAFRAIGAGILGSIGTGLAGALGLAGGPLAIATAALGGLAGGALGDMAGGALYDLFFGKKKPQGKVAKAAGGGMPSTRGGKLVGGPAKRTVKKKKAPRTLTVTPSKVKPGASVGGEKKIKQLFPEPDPKEKNKMNPFQFLKNTYDVFSKSTGFGSIVALAIKPLLGDKPTFVDYKNAGIGINNWMNNALSPETYGYAGGGEVKMESIISGDDYSNVIAKSLQDSVTPQVDKTLHDLMKNLAMRPVGREEMTQENIKKGSSDEENFSNSGDDASYSTNSGDYKQLLDLISKHESAGAGYNAYNEGGASGGYRVIGYGGDSRTGPLKRSLTDMTIKEIMAHQRNVNPPIHAAGRYQIIGSTLASLMGGGYGTTGVKVDDKFTPDVQDKLGIALIKYRLKTGATPENFISEWRGLKFADRKQLQNAISKAQKGRIYSLDTSATNLPATSKAQSLSRGSITSYFGSKESFRKKGHEGVDIGLNQGTPLSFKMGGTIINSFRTSSRDREAGGGYGSYMDVRLDNGNILRLAHLSKIFPGSKFKAGSVVALSGGKPGYPGSGRSGGPHLHLEQHSAKLGTEETIKGKLDPVRYGGFSLIQTGGIVPRFHGGPILKTGMLFAHKGEFVIDKDSVDLFGIDLIDSINRIENKSQLIAKVPSIIEKLKAISGYTDYEQLSEPKVVFMQMPAQEPARGSYGGGKASAYYVRGSIDNSISSQISDSLMYG